jgi:hypothetical protein
VRFSVRHSGPGPFPPGRPVPFRFAAARPHARPQVRPGLVSGRPTMEPLARNRHICAYRKGGSGGGSGAASGPPSSPNEKRYIDARTGLNRRVRSRRNVRPRAMAQRNKGRPRRNVIPRAMAQRNKGRPRRNVTPRAMAQRNKGRPRRNVIPRAMAQRNKGRPRRNVTPLAMAQRNKGRPRVNSQMKSSRTLRPGFPDSGCRPPKAADRLSGPMRRTEVPRPRGPTPGVPPQRPARTYSLEATAGINGDGIAAAEAATTRTLRTHAPDGGAPSSGPDARRSLAVEEE